MKIAFNKKIVQGPWGGGNQMLLLLVNYLRKCKFNVVFSLDDTPDVVVIMDIKDTSCSFTIEQLKIYKKQTNCKVIHRVNDNGSHRGNGNERNDQRMIDVNLDLADKTIFISQWLKDYYEERGLVREESTVIPNGTDRDLFYPVKEIIRKAEDPVKIVTHHWSNNMAKGYKIYDSLATFCNENPAIAQFTFMGNRPPDMMAGAKILHPHPYIEIPAFLRQHDIYVTATQFESGGCHVVEGMACGLVPFVRYGGGGVEEYVKGYALYYDTADELIDIVKKIHGSYDLYYSMANKLRDEYTYGTSEMCAKYKEVITDGMVARSM